jgi:hypothetical protein
MSLSKKICKRCMNKFLGDEGDGIWGESSECSWKHEYIVCPEKVKALNMVPIPIQGVPPEWCPFALEHVVSQK